jgi:hypothetical protein
MSKVFVTTEAEEEEYPKVRLEIVVLAMLGSVLSVCRLLRTSNPRRRSTTLPGSKFRALVQESQLFRKDEAGQN